MKERLTDGDVIVVEVIRDLLLAQGLLGVFGIGVKVLTLRKRSCEVLSSHALSFQHVHLTQLLDRNLSHTGLTVLV